VNGCACVWRAHECVHVCMHVSVCMGGGGGMCIVMDVSSEHTCIYASDPVMETATM